MKEACKIWHTVGTWVWVNSGSWWWTGRPGVLRFMGSQRVGHDWATDLIWSDLKAMAPHSSTLAWKIPWTEDPGGLQSMRSLRVGHDWPTSFHFSLLCIGEGNGNPLRCFCLENPRDGGAWWAAVYGVEQSWTRLKWLSSSSSSSTFNLRDFSYYYYYL